MKHELTTEQLDQVKKWKPEWFRPVFKDNTWYKHTSHRSIQFNKKDGNGYGINHSKEWIDDAAWLANYPENGEWREATSQEVEYLLIEEAKKRGFKVGINTEYGKISNDKWKKKFEWEDCGLYCHNILVFRSETGTWTKISNDIHNDIQALKDKYPDYNLTIIAEKK